MAPLRADRGSRPLTPSPNKPSFLCPGSRGPAPPPVPCPLETALSTCSLEAPTAPGETHFVRRVCGLTQTSGRSGGLHDVTPESPALCAVESGGGDQTQGCLEDALRQGARTAASTEDRAAVPLPGASSPLRFADHEESGP